MPDMKSWGELLALFLLERPRDQRDELGRGRCYGITDRSFTLQAESLSHCNRSS